MRKLLYLVLSGFLIMTVSSCHSKDEKNRDPKARELYEKSLAITKAYADSMRLAKDSTEAERLSKGYENDLTRLNYDYAPDLGLEISEGENDTLTRVTLRFVELRDSVMRSFANRQAVPKDSVS